MLGAAYGRYKKTRDASWQALLDNNINSLPVDVVKVVNQNNITIIKDSDIKELRPGERGISIFDGTEWFIVYDDLLDLPNKRFTIAHELGHIFLGHPLVAGFHTRDRISHHTEKHATEKQADSFAIRFLSPACVLWGLNLHTATEISQICNLSDDKSIKREKRMEVLYKNNKILTSSLEKKVFEQFKDFIDSKIY